MTDLPAADGQRHDLVVIGASAGGVEALRQLVGGLPSDLPAAVCVVLHIAPGSPSALAPILDRAGPLPCRAAENGARLEPGCILVAPPDRHLLVADDHVRLSVGPRENGHRPAVDALFRSAAEERGVRALGVILSGTRDDGSAGLAAIKAAGGAALVQDPQEALYAGMPINALAHVSVDAILPAGELARGIAAMVSGNPVPGVAPEHTRNLERAPDAPVTTVCPECGGVLSERHQAGMTQRACDVGHRYHPASGGAAGGGGRGGGVMRG